MEDESDIEGPFVALALRIEANNTITLQMLTVEDKSDDQSSMSVLSTPRDHSSINSEALAEILEASATDDTTSDIASETDGSLEHPTQEMSGMSPVMPMAPLIKSDSELEVMVKDAWDQYTIDRSKHCTLIQRLNAALKDARTKKRMLLGSMLERWYPRVKADPVYRQLMMDHQEQLLRMTVQGSAIMTAIEQRRDHSCRRGASIHSGAQTHVFTKAPMPQWLTDKDRSVISSRGIEREMHPLRDMVLQIHDNGERDADRSVRWIPKGGHPSLPTRQPSPPTSPTVTVSISKIGDASDGGPSTVSLHDDQATSSPTKTDAASSPSAPSETSVDSSVSVPESQTPIESIQPPIGVQASETAGVKEEAEEEAVSSLMGMMQMGPTVEAPTSLSVQSSPLLGPKTPSPTPEKAEMPPKLQQLAPAGEGMGQMSVDARLFSQQPFRPSTDVSHQASFIAGGAAFGESSVPRSSFVAPQLGSLQGTTPAPSGGTFAGITGGFAVFAKQGNALSTQGGGSPFSQTPPSGFGGTPSSLFGQRSKTVNDKLMQMRK